MPKKGSDKVGKTLHEFKTGKLHSGSKQGPVVKDRKQAIAIGLSEQRTKDAQAKTERKLKGKPV